jgi:hypothetical protein
LGVTDFVIIDDNVMPVTVERRTSVPPTRWHHPTRNPMTRKYRRRGAATCVQAVRDRVDPAEAEKRLAEREAREAADTRTEAERWLGDPPPSRSALAARMTMK